MGKRILFVNPSHGQLKHYVILPPLGVGYVARALKEAGHEVHFVDALKGFMTPDMFRAWLDEKARNPARGKCYSSPNEVTFLSCLWLS